MDDGTAIHYSAVARGTPVYASDGTQVGVVDQVVDNYREHILDGIVIETEQPRPALRRRPGGRADRRARRDARHRRGRGREPAAPGERRRDVQRERPDRTPGKALRAVLETRLAVTNGGYRTAVPDESRVEFSLPAEAANVPLIRHALAGLAEALEMEPTEIADLKTVVTEACMNVVLHAYDESETGPLEVDAWPVERLPHRSGPRLRRRDPAARRRRAHQPAARPAADRRAHAQLRDQRRPGRRHLGADDACPCPRTGTSRPPVPEVPDETRISPADRRPARADPLAGDLDVRDPCRPLGRRALRRGPAQRRDLGQRPQRLSRRHRADRGLRAGGLVRGPGRPPRRRGRAAPAGRDADPLPRRLARGARRGGPGRPDRRRRRGARDPRRAPRAERPQPGSSSPTAASRSLPSARRRMRDTCICE